MPRQRTQRRSETSETSKTSKTKKTTRSATRSTPLAQSATAGWRRELDRWLAPFLDLLGDARRRPWGAAYVRGLLSRSERKSFAVMADHLAATDPTATDARSHHLQHFITNSPWDPAPVERLIAQRADAMVGGPDAVLIADDTSLLKQGDHSVGVAHQYAGAAGKLANCQTLVSLTLAQGEVPVCVSLKLYLPAEWTRDAERCDTAGVPADARRLRTKMAIAIAEIQRLQDTGVGWGRRPIPPAASACGRSRVNRVVTVAEMLRGAKWQTVRWRHGTQGKLTGQWTAVRVRVADGPEGRKGEHMPGEIVWLVGEQQPDGKRRYYFTNHPRITSLRKLVQAIRKRWACEQAHQQLKQELGLSHFEGRRWAGLHRHALLTMLSCAFLQHLRLQAARQIAGKKTSNASHPVFAEPAPVAHTPDGPACPHCQALLRTTHLSTLR